ncbi:hypothetical protein FDECE_15566 [Fusarium decemcellulare]|nr:hypothetical protein FDECE_15566 [Fusarium decemcellulare]
MTSQFLHRRLQMTVGPVFPFPMALKIFGEGGLPHCGSMRGFHETDPRDDEDNSDESDDNDDAEAPAAPVTLNYGPEDSSLASSSDHSDDGNGGDDEDSDAEMVDVPPIHHMHRHKHNIITATSTPLPGTLLKIHRSRLMRHAGSMDVLESALRTALDTIAARGARPVKEDTISSKQVAIRKETPQAYSSAQTSAKVRSKSPLLTVSTLQGVQGVEQGREDGAADVVVEVDAQPPTILLLGDLFRNVGLADLIDGDFLAHGGRYKGLSSRVSRRYGTSRSARPVCKRRDGRD